MAHLIDKDDLLAKIKILMFDEFEFMCDSYDEATGFQSALREIEKFIDTLEVKEVDLEKEYKKFVEEDTVYNKLVNNIVGKAIAKHFFELGMQQSKNDNNNEEKK